MLPFVSSSTCGHRCFQRTGLPADDLLVCCLLVPFPTQIGRKLFKLKTGRSGTRPLPDLRCRLFLVHTGLKYAGELTSWGVDHANQLSRRSLEYSKNPGTKNFNGRQVGEFHQVLAFEPLAFQISELDIALGKFLGKTLQDFRGG